MRRRTVPLLLTVLLFIPSAAYARKTYSADRLDVELVLGRDGSMLVTETTVLRFVGGTFTRFSRRIPTDRTDGIADITASFDGVPCGRSGGVRLEIDRDNGLTAIWHFAPVADSVHVFVLKYRALGVVERGPDRDVVAWRVLPGDRAYSVRSSLVKLTYPEGATLVGQPAVQPAVASAMEHGAVVFVVSELSASQPVRVAVRFAPGSVTSATPEWQARRARGLEVAPAIATGAGVILLSGFAWILLFWNSHRREPIGSDGSYRQSVPPGALPAALAGALTRTGQSPVWADAFGAILELSRRGLLRIEEAPDRSWHHRREFVVCLVQRGNELRSHERALLDLLFLTRKGPRPSVKFSELKGAVTSGWKPFSRAVLGELGAKGLVSPDRQHTRRWLVGVAVILIVAGSLGFIPAGLLVNRLEGWPLMLPGAVAVVGLAALIFATAFSILSDEGRRQSAAWRAFFHGLRDVARGRQPVGEPETFDRYLAYATAAGVSEAWARAFRKGGKLVAVPPWFGMLMAPDAGHAEDSLVAMLGTGMASTRSKHGAHVT